MGAEQRSVFGMDSASVVSQTALVFERMHTSFILTDREFFSGAGVQGFSQVTGPTAGCAAVVMRVGRCSSCVSGGAMPCLLWLVCYRH